MDFFPATADKFLQRRSSGRFRGGLESERAGVQHTPKHPLCWLYLDADTLVSTHVGITGLILNVISGICF